jgi:hypothetical protein
MKPAILPAAALNVEHGGAKSLLIDFFGSRDGKNRSASENFAKVSLKPVDDYGEPPSHGTLLREKTPACSPAMFVSRRYPPVRRAAKSRPRFDQERARSSVASAIRRKPRRPPRLAPRVPCPPEGRTRTRRQKQKSPQPHRDKGCKSRDLDSLTLPVYHAYRARFTQAPLRDSANRSKTPLSPSFPLRKQERSGRLLAHRVDACKIAKAKPCPLFT